MPKQNVPALRLHGFSGEWKTASIGAVSALHNGRDYKHLGEGCIPVYGTGGYMAAVDQALSHDKDAVGIGRKGTINKPYILKAPFWTVDTLFYVVPNQDTDLAFFYASVLRVDWMAKNTATGLPSLTSQAINSADISVPPTLEEQQAIGAIFTNLDAAINQHTLKHKSLQQSKTALMQRMFPQEGQTVPELRLEGFSGEWGSAPLQQLASLFTDGDWIESKDQSTEGIRLLQTGNVGIGTFVQKSATQKWISEETFKRLRCQEVLPGDILISRLPDPAGRACIVPMMPYRLITAVDCTIVRLSEENDADYLVAYLGNPSYFEHIDTLLAGGTRQRVSRSQLAAIEVPVPPTLEEQQAIGAVFTNLDQLIAAEAQYIASLKQAKTALLQRMFI